MLELLNATQHKKRFERKFVLHPPIPRKVYAQQMAASGRYIFSHGGRGADGNITGETFAFDLLENKWETRRPSPVPVYQGGTAVIDNKLYIYGGANIGQGDVGNLQCYDFNSDTWTLLASDERNNQPSVFGYNNDLYAFFGLVGGSLSSKKRHYSLLNNTWSDATVNNSMPATGFTYPLKIGTKVYFIGGYRVNPAYVKEFWVLDLPTMTFSRLPDLPFGVYANCCFFDDESIIVTGGWSESLGGNFILEFSFNTNSWKQIGDNPYGSPGNQSCQIDGRSFILGGRPGSTPDTAVDTFVEYT